MTDKNVIQTAVLVLGEMYRSNAFNEVDPQSMAQEAVEMAIYMTQHFKILKSKMPTPNLEN